MNFAAFSENTAELNEYRSCMTRQPAARGFGFVEMPDDEEAERAIRALNGATLGGQALKVNEARPRAARAESAGGGNGERRFGRS